MGDNLAELLYMAWRSERLPFEPELPSWGNVRDPDVRRAWEAAATKARGVFEAKVNSEIKMLREANAAWQRQATHSPFVYGEHNAPGNCDDSLCIGCATPIKQGDTVTDWEEGYKHHPTCPTTEPR